MIILLKKYENYIGKLVQCPNNPYDLTSILRQLCCCFGADKSYAVATICLIRTNLIGSHVEESEETGLVG